MGDGKSVQDILNEWRSELPSDALCLNLGSGKRPMEGFKGVDLCEGADIRANLFEAPWPLKSNSVDLVFSSHFVEHLPDWDAFFTELYRVMKPGAKAVFQGPYWSSVRAFQDPDHKQPLSAERFLYLSKHWREANKIDHYGASVAFEMIYEPWYVYHPDFLRDGISDEAREFARKHYINSVLDIFVFLRKEED